MKKFLLLAFICLTTTILAQEKTIPENEWVKLENLPEQAQAEFKNIKKHINFVSTKPKPKGSNWKVIQKWAEYSAIQKGLWISDQKKYFHMLNSRYAKVNPRLYLVDQNVDPLEKIKSMKNVKGWTLLKSQNGFFSAPLRWASTAYMPTQKEVLLFGGNSQSKTGGEGTCIYSFTKQAWERLDFSNMKMYPVWKSANTLLDTLKSFEGRLRNRLHLAESKEEKSENLQPNFQAITKELELLSSNTTKASVSDQEKLQANTAKLFLTEVIKRAQTLSKDNFKKPTGKMTGEIVAIENLLRIIRDIVAVEPTPRAATSMAFDEKNNRILLYGGDHLDYLFSDTWFFECTTKKWRQVFPKSSPTPTGSHALTYLPTTGKFIMTCASKYYSFTGYGGVGYKRPPLEMWVYSPNSNNWQFIKEWAQPARKAKKNIPTQSHNPERFFTGTMSATKSGYLYKEGDWVLKLSLKKIDAKAKKVSTTGQIGMREKWYTTEWWDKDIQTTQVKLSEVKNQWIPIKAQKTFHICRDWGTATFDVDRQQIFYFSGGHCVYSGTDVSIYSVNTNTWRTSNQVEMPGGFGGGTGYHGQTWSFNQSPFMSSHTYKLYAYDPIIQKMVLSNRDATHFLNAKTSRWEKSPQPLPFKGAWVPHLTSSPKGVYAWSTGKKSPLWKMDAKTNKWIQLEVTNGKIPKASSDDYSTLVYDSKRDQLILISNGRKGTITYMSRYDIKTKTVTKITPTQMDLKPYFIRESIYIPEYDLIMFASGPKHGKGQYQISFYDIEINRFRVFSPKKEDSKKAQQTYGGHGAGLMYDFKRGRIWIVYSGYGWPAYYMNFDLKTADIKDTP